MPNKTSQLQIRITTGQKLRLKALAAEAGLNVSQYVLSTVLPTRGPDELAERTRAMRTPEDRVAALSDVVRYMTALSTPELRRVLADADLGFLPPIPRNHVAALVETVARARGIDPPAWLGRIDRLARPHFARDLPSLYPHQMRVTPVAFKVRNAFVDVEAYGGLRDPDLRVPGSGARVPPWLERVNAELRARDMSAELCAVDGTVAHVLFAARPATRSIAGLFEHPSLLRDAIDSARPRSLANTTSIDSLVLEVIRPGGPGFLELSNLRVYAGRMDYALAVATASLRTGADPVTLASIKGIIRTRGLADLSVVLALIERFLLRRQLPAGVDAILGNLLTDGGSP